MLADSYERACITNVLVNSKRICAKMVRLEIERSSFSRRTLRISALILTWMPEPMILIFGPKELGDSER